MFFGISAQNDAEWWSSCRDWIDFRMSFWNSLNILSNNASTVGSYDLELFSSKNGENETLKKIKKNEFDVIFLFGQENLKFKKKNEFINKHHHKK